MQTDKQIYLIFQAEPQWVFELAGEQSPAPCYNWIKTSSIAESAKAVLLDVFLNWLEQRLNHKGKKEIEEMLIGQLPDLRETQSGKDLIAIGRSEGKNEGKLEGKLEGKIEGKIEGLIELLEIRFGEIPKPLRDELLQIKSIVAVDALYKKALAISSLRDFSCR